MVKGDDWWDTFIDKELYAWSCETTRAWKGG